MIQLEQAYVDNNSKNHIVNSANILTHFSNMSFNEIATLLSSKNMMNRNTIAIKFEQYKYLDELFLNDDARTDFEELVFSLIENKNCTYRYV